MSKIDEEAKAISQKLSEATEQNPLWSQTHSHWEDHPEHSVEDWRHEIEENNTRLGYGQWVDACIEQAAEDQPDADDEGIEP